MATGTLSKRMTAAFAMSVNDIKMTYARQKSDIDKSLRFTPGVYDASIAMVYAFLKMPESVIKRTMGTIPGMAFSFMYSAYVAPVRVVLNVLDLRTLKGFFATIIYFVKDCVPKLFSSLLTKMFQTLADLFNALAKSLTSIKKVNNLKGRQMLTESKAVLMEGKIWDWFETKFKINISDLRYPKKTHKKETHYVCCGFFEKTIRYYQWFELIEGDKLLLVMPCFPDTKTRVNYCPVCGKHIRDVEFDEETFKKYV